MFNFHLLQTQRGNRTFSNARIHGQLHTAVQHSLHFLHEEPNRGVQLSTPHHHTQFAEYSIRKYANTYDGKSEEETETYY